jgi:hypothetical protein
MRVDDVAGDICQTIQGGGEVMPFNSRDEGTTCVSITWRAMSGRPYQRRGGRQEHLAHL